MSNKAQRRRAASQGTTGNDRELDTVSFLEKELERLLDWVRAAESRLALTLPLGTAMLGALAVLAPSAADWEPLEAVFVVLAAIGLVICMVACWFATFPRTGGPKGSLIYFGTIADKSSSQYAAAVRDLSEDDYITDLAEQCHRNAQIAERKHACIKVAMRCLLVSSVPWTIALFLLYSR